MEHTYLIFVLLVISISLSANSIEPRIDTIPFKKWSFGAQLTDFEIGENRATFGLGLFAERRLSKNFGIEAELSLAQESFNEFDFDVIQYPSWNRRYGKASISGKYYFGKNKRWFGKAGLSADYYFGTNYYTKYNELNPSNPRSAPDLSFKDKLGSSLLLGVGYEVPLRKGGGLKFELNYNHGAELPASKSKFKIGYRF